MPRGGLGLARARDLVPVALRSAGAPAVVLGCRCQLTAFADALGALFRHAAPALRADDPAPPATLRAIFPDIRERGWMRPQPGDRPYSKVAGHARGPAPRPACVVLFKGADTVIADASGACSINSAVHERAAPWLATAGAGDVLAGMIAGLLARGLAPMQAAETAAWLHVEAARAFGPGLIAEDLPEMLPRVFGDLEL